MHDPLKIGITITVAALLVAIAVARWLLRQTPPPVREVTPAPAVADPDDVLVALGGPLEGYYIHFDLIVRVLENEGQRQALALKAVANLDMWGPYVLQKSGSPVKMMKKGEAERRGFKPFIRS